MNNQKKVFLFFLLIGVGLLFAFVNQIDFAAHLQQKLNLFYQRHIPVALHLTFNQPRYTAGDTAYYRVDFFTADHQYPVEGRQIINVSLLDGMGNVLRDSRVLLKDGSASNQILLPSNLSPGKYSVVAYHEVMKNHDRSLFFQRPLWISGPTQF